MLNTTQQIGKFNAASKIRGGTTEETKHEHDEERTDVEPVNFISNKTFTNFKQY